MPLAIKVPLGLKYVGSDLTPGTASNTTTETVIGQVTVPANTVKNLLIPVASLYSYNNTDSTAVYTFRIRCGTAGDTSDTLYALQFSAIIGISGAAILEMGGILTYITGPDWTVQNYVSVTVEMDTASVNVLANCQAIVIIGE